jgi:hypothetical protein
VKITLTLEDTPTGPRISCTGSGNNVLDHGRDSIAAHLASGWLFATLQLHTQGAIRATWDKGVAGLLEGLGAPPGAAHVGAKN